MNGEELVVVKKSKEELEEKSFASGLNFYKLFWIFFIGCFLGVVVETIYCIFQFNRIESRTALVWGPFNPVYGFGAVLMTLCFNMFKEKKGAYIFVFCMVIGSAFEYLCSFFQEMAFGTVSWYYTASNFGIGDRISIIYAIFWGALGLFWIKGIYPLLSKWIEKIPNKIGKPITIILAIFLTVDMIYSCMAVYRQSERRKGIPATNSIQNHFDKNYPDTVLKKIYPNMIVK